MPVPPAQRALYRALYGAGEPGWAQRNWRLRSGAPNLRWQGCWARWAGASTGRPAWTQNNPPGVSLMFEIVQKDGQWHYRMRDELRNVLEAQQPPWLHPKP